MDFEEKQTRVIQDDSESVSHVAPLNDKFKYQKFTPQEVVDFLNKHIPPVKSLGLDFILDGNKPKDKICPLNGKDGCHNFKYRNLARLKSHLMFDHLKQQFQCKICKKWFKESEKKRDNHQNKCKA